MPDVSQPELDRCAKQELHGQHYGHADGKMAVERFVAEQLHGENAAERAPGRRPAEQRRQSVTFYPPIPPIITNLSEGTATRRPPFRLPTPPEKEVKK